MKLVKLLDQKGTLIVSDPLNQTILKNLVMSEYSVSEMAAKLNMPTLKLWRRMQKLLKANLVELSRTEKVGNLDKKFYRATATGYVPQQQFLELKPKDPKLTEAFELYSEIQSKMMAVVSGFGDVPKDAYPTDYAMFASMYAFAKVFAESTAQVRLLELKAKLDQYQEQSKLLKTEST